jgi:hypothetical protein
MNRVLLVLSLVLVVPACGDGDNGSEDAGVDLGADMSGAAGECTAARAQLLGSVDSVATGDVQVVSANGGIKTLSVDASAGGITHPWLFLSLDSGSKVSVTDKTSVSSTAWDLAFKRAVLYTNDGSGGPGQGGAVLIAKDIAQVTAADASGAAFQTESCFDAQCNPQLDPVGEVLTTMSGWYDYDQATHILTPAAGTWLIRGGGGKLFALALESYYGSNDDGGVDANAGGVYLLEVKALQ